MYIVIAIVIFGVLITVHELGHFTAAKLCGVKVSEFAIGMGPALFKRQRGETLYSLRALPIGGYCAMEEDEESDDPDSFVNKSWWKRLIILVAGSVMNILAGYIILLFIVPGTSYMPEGAGFFGIFRAAWDASINLGQLVWLGLSQLVSGEVGLSDLSGPVGIVGIISQVGSGAETARLAALQISHLAAFIAINLGIMNLLPIPALDGGRILFLLVNTVVEKTTKRKLNPKYEGYVHAAGMILLLGLMAVVMFSDIYKLFQ